MLNSPLFKSYKNDIIKILKNKHPDDFDVDNIEFYSWPYATGGTSSSGACGQVVSKSQIFAFVNPIWRDCVLIVGGGKLRYRKNFTPLMEI